MKVIQTQRVPFGSRLNIVLRAKKMQKKDLAKMISVSDSNVSKYLYEKAYPSLPALVQIAKVLNVSTDYLLGLTSGKIEESKPKEQEDEEI
jgi:transcriptional regulator with XRE-family HTH domain